MSPAVKYTLGRFGLFLLVLVLLLPVPLNILVKAMIALVVSAVLSYFLMADWRNQMAEHLAAAADRRAAEKERLRAALAGDEGAAAAGDRAASAGAASASAASGGAASASADDRVTRPATDTPAPVVEQSEPGDTARPPADAEIAGKKTSEEARESGAVDHDAPLRADQGEGAARTGESAAVKDVQAAADKK
jgi:hypothetical protein